MMQDSSKVKAELLKVAATFPILAVKIIGVIGFLFPIAWYEPYVLTRMALTLPPLTGVIASIGLVVGTIVFISEFLTLPIWQKYEAAIDRILNK